VNELLELVGLGDMGQKYPAQMSGGQQQRVALARALAPSPSLLLLDEPLSALDARVRVRLRQEIRHLQEQLGVTTVMVTHDQEEALTMADRVVVISEGNLVQYGMPQEIYRSPQDTFVAGFIGSMNFLNHWVVQDTETVSSGDLILKVDNNKTSDLVGSEVTIAIRPEDIHVLNGNKPEHNVLDAWVEDYEFRGSFYRLKLRLNMEESQYLELDLQSDHVERFGIMKDSIIPIYLPSERLLIFSQPVHNTAIA
jgi:iron(III) transport system ATP-binding protein